MKKSGRRRSHKRKKGRAIIFLLILLTVLGFFLFRNSMEADSSLGWRLILVNEAHRVPHNYEPELTRLSNGEQVDSRIYPPLQKMFDDARAHGLNLFVREGYRTEDEQKELLDEKILTYENEGYSRKEAKKLAREYVASPSTSEHQLGLAVDINAETEKTSSESVYQWLQENAHNYGFIKRYPSDKIEITGISNEPWHYRYVGKKAARKMKRQNLCLEEYVDIKKAKRSGVPDYICFLYEALSMLRTRKQVTWPFFLSYFLTPFSQYERLAPGKFQSFLQSAAVSDL